MSLKKKKNNLRVFSRYFILFNILNFFKNSLSFAYLYLYCYSILTLLSYYKVYSITLFFKHKVVYSRISLIYLNNFFYFKNKNFRSIYKLFFFNYFKNVIVLYFFLFKKNIKNIFFLNFFSNFKNYYFSIKNVINFFGKFNNISLKKKTGIVLNFKINQQNKRRSILLNLSNIFKNFMNNGSLVLKFSNLNFFFSFFSLWNFLLFLPISNFFLVTIQQSCKYPLLPFFNNVSRILLKNNFSICKYFNVYNYNFSEGSFSKLIYFRHLRNKLLRFIEDSHFSDILVRLVGSVSNMKSLIFINKSLKQQLTIKEWMKFDLLRRRFKQSVHLNFLKFNTKFLQAPTEFVYGRKFGINFYWFELTLVCFLTFKLKDSTFLMTYLYNKMRRMSLFKHRSFLRRVFFILRVMFCEIGSWYSVVGVRLRIVGKISVTGNSRTRTMHFKEGIVSNSNMTTRVDHSYTIIRTNTGCLGLSIWFFF